MGRLLGFAWVVGFFWLKDDGKNENTNCTKYLSEKPSILLSAEPQQNTLCKTKETKTKIKIRASMYYIFLHIILGSFLWLKINVSEFGFYCPLTIQCIFHMQARTVASSTHAKQETQINFLSLLLNKGHISSKKCQALRTEKEFSLAV